MYGRVDAARASSCTLVRTSITGADASELYPVDSTAELTTSVCAVMTATRERSRRLVRCRRMSRPLVHHARSSLDGCLEQHLPHQCALTASTSGSISAEVPALAGTTSWRQFSELNPQTTTTMMFDPCVLKYELDGVCIEYCLARPASAAAIARALAVYREGLRRFAAVYVSKRIRLYAWPCVITGARRIRGTTSGGH
jgi:hypothetical protein